MHGAAPAIYRFTRELLNSVRELISCLGAFRARQLLGGRRRRKTAGLRPVKLSPAANGPGIAAKIARGRRPSGPPKAPKTGFYLGISRFPEVLPEKRVGVIQIRKQILLRNSKGEGNRAARVEARQCCFRISTEIHPRRPSYVVGPRAHAAAI